MIICICKNLSGAKIRTAIEAGVEKAENVHRFHGCSHQCGSCLEEIDQMIAAARFSMAAE
jgi:bacterioferritin-associated ferredoxin